MIPQHLLDNLGRDDRIAILTRDGELRFMVHRATDSPADVQARARREGADVVASHLSDKKEILALVAGRERDIGGEG